MKKRGVSKTSSLGKTPPFVQRLGLPQQTDDGALTQVLLFTLSRRDSLYLGKEMSDATKVKVPPSGEAGSGAALPQNGKQSPRLVRLIVARRRDVWAVVYALLFAVSIWRYWEGHDTYVSVPDEPETFHVAYNLLQKHEFANPFSTLDTGPSAHLAPLFPAYLALMIKLFGVGSKGMDAIIFACVLVVSLQLAFFPLISSSLGMGKLNGVIGACFWLASKPRLVYGFEAMYAGALFALTCCVYRRFLDRDRGNAKLAWPLGILMGLLILTIPTVVPILAIWILREVWRYKFSFLKSAGLPLILLPTLIVAPWTIRNYSIFHRVVPVRDDLGLELSVSNNDCARFGIRKSESYGCFNNIHPNKSIIEARKVKAKGEVQYNDMRLRQALDWIRGHPARFSKLTAERFLAFWLPTETGTRRHYAGLGRRWERLIIYLMTLLSVAGIVILYRRDAESAMIYMLCLAIFPLVHYLIQFEYRYRYPIIWITFLLGALPITTCLARLGSNFFPRELAQLEESKLTANG